MGRGYRRKHQKDTAPVPVDVHPRLDKLQTTMLEAAGYSEQELATIARDAVETARSALTAMETKIVSHEGEITDRIELVNWKARLQGVRELLEILGGYKGRAATAAAAVKVEIELKSAPTVHDRTVMNAQAVDI